jgi:HAD superfamily hydrolase (TIGR01549 family)
MNPAAFPRGLGFRAVLLDVDGTLYRQAPLRLRMAGELLAHGCGAPRETLRIVRALRVFRACRERLRSHARQGVAPCSELQYDVPASEAGVDAGLLRRIVSEWIESRPLRHLTACRREGLPEFLEECRKRRLRVGAYSDYPTQEKIRALELGRFFDLQLCSVDAEVNAFKPSPAGILEACRRWSLAPAEVLYVGDRSDVDGEAARAAGAAFVHLGGAATRQEAAAADFRELAALLGWERE